MPHDGLPPGPLTEKLGFSEIQMEGVREAQEAVGLRALPYPFSSAMAVLSDCDGASRSLYGAYVGAFTRLGLDFGDSIWLRWNLQKLASQDAGLGFFSDTFTKTSSRGAHSPEPTRNFAESVAEYHLGNIDHFHSLLRDGPRVVILAGEVPDGERVEVATGPFQVGGPWRTEHLPLFGLLIEGDCAQAGVVENDVTGDFDFHRAAEAPPGHALFVLRLDPDAQGRAPVLKNVRAIRLGGARNVRRIVLLSCHGELLVDRVSYLRTYDIEINTITEHARQHFRNPRGAAIDDEQALERLKSHAGPLPGLCGAIDDEAGLIVSTDADDPESISRVLPELFDLGLRFLVPMAASGDDGFEPLELVSPTPTRAGGGGYWARRTLPLGPKSGPTRQSSFTRRLTAALDGAREQPGRFWPIYTHLGGMDPVPGMPNREVVPDPFFDAAPMRALQDAALGLSGEARRMWFTRGGVLYDYALILRSIVDHVRRKGDRIDIESWRDAALGRTLPCSPAQLYGLTFHVKDAATATIRLDGKVIETVSRNPADITGRQSLTVVESEIRAILFDRLDPLRNHPDEALIEGACAWRDGRLRVDGAVTIPLHGWAAPGAQALVLDIDGAAGGAFGLRLRTQAGGSFYFGDPRWKDGADDAAYAFLGRDAGRHVAPFWDMAWRAPAGGEHLPNHPLASMTLMGKAEFAALALLRPRATTLERSGFCVAGRVAGAAPGQTVELGDRRETVDRRGWFCFSQVPGGVYRLTSGDRCDRRGPWVEIGSDRGDLRLDRPI